MASVVHIHFNMQEEYRIEHAICKCHVFTILINLMTIVSSLGSALFIRIMHDVHNGLQIKFPTHKTKKNYTYNMLMYLYWDIHTIESIQSDKCLNYYTKYKPWRKWVSFIFAIHFHISLIKTLRTFSSMQYSSLKSWPSYTYHWIRAMSKMKLALFIVSLSLYCMNPLCTLPQFTNL